MDACHEIVIIIWCLEGTTTRLPAAGIQEFLQNNSHKRVVTPESIMDACHEIAMMRIE